MQPNFTERSDVKLVQMSEKPNLFFFLFPNESNFGEAQVTIFWLIESSFYNLLFWTGEKHRICKQVCNYGITSFRRHIFDVQILNQQTIIPCKGTHFYRK